MEMMGKFLNDSIFIPLIEWCLRGFAGTFETSLDVLNVYAGMTPSHFSPSIVTILSNISRDVLHPIAGLLLTYIFCYELINMVTEKNNMSEFEIKGLIMLFIRTGVIILLITDSFKITLAFFDVGRYLVKGVTESGAVTKLPIDDIVIAIKASIGGNVGKGLAVGMFSLIAWVVGYIACGLIYLVAWSRIIKILLYVSVAPIPFATFMSKDWIGHIGQNYIKNLMALAFQGFFMVICMIIYGGLVIQVKEVIVESNKTGGDGAILGIVLLLVSMFVCVKSLMSCLDLSKSIFGAQ